MAEEQACAGVAALHTPAQPEAGGWPGVSGPLPSSSGLSTKSEELYQQSCGPALPQEAQPPGLHPGPVGQGPVTKYHKLGDTTEVYSLTPL